MLRRSCRLVSPLRSRAASWCSMRWLSSSSSGPSSLLPNVAQQESVTATQAPNRVKPWSESQEPRSIAMSGPRFEQVDLSAQPRPAAAIELIQAQPVIKVKARIACCDGGGGPLGHPKVYINLDRDGPNECGYCGLRFEQEHAH